MGPGAAAGSGPHRGRSCPLETAAQSEGSGGRWPSRRPAALMVNTQTGQWPQPGPRALRLYRSSGGPGCLAPPQRPWRVTECELDPPGTPEGAWHLGCPFLFLIPRLWT